MTRNANTADQPVIVQEYKPFGTKFAIPAPRVFVVPVEKKAAPQAWNGRIDPIKLAIAKYERERINKMLGY